MSVLDTMISKLTDQFTPDFLEVIDESEKHHGHSGWREEGETHFRVRIGTRHFDGMTRIAQHRAVMESLKSEINSGVHALAIEIVPADGPLKVENPK